MSEVASWPPWHAVQLHKQVRTTQVTTQDIYLKIWKMLEKPAGCFFSFFSPKNIFVSANKNVKLIQIECKFKNSKKCNEALKSIYRIQEKVLKWVKMGTLLECSKLNDNDMTMLKGLETSLFSHLTALWLFLFWWSALEAREKVSLNSILGGIYLELSPVKPCCLMSSSPMWIGPATD